MSDHCRVADSLVEAVNSLALRKPKKATVKAAHMRRCSRSEKSEVLSCLFRVLSRFIVIGKRWHVESP